MLKQPVLISDPRFTAHIHPPYSKVDIAKEDYSALTSDTVTIQHPTGFLFCVLLARILWTEIKITLLVKLLMRKYSLTIVTTGKIST